MTLQAAQEFIQKLSADDQLAEEVGRKAREPRQVGELARKAGFDFTRGELEVALERAGRSRLRSPGLSRLRGAAQKWSGATPLASGDNKKSDHEGAGKVAGDPGPAGVANKRGKKAPWRASW